MNHTRNIKQTKAGFTLIEVLLALTIITIALTALLKVTAQNIENTNRIKDKTISHWIAMQAVAMIQLDLIQLNSNHESTQVSTMLGRSWYWKAKIKKTAIKSIQKITIVVSQKHTGPFSKELIAFRYLPKNKTS
jgi:general secretion pathway protein I